MPRWERTVEINTSPAHVWSVMAEVGKWPEWTASILSVEEVSPGFGLGGSALVHAKGTPKSKYTVTRWEPGAGFNWQTRVRGASAIAGHWIEGAGEGRSRVTLSVEVRGPIAALLKPVLGRRFAPNIETEAQGLKRRCEANT